MWTDVFDVGTSDSCKGFCPSMPSISQSVKENNRGGGLVGGGHDGRQRGGHVATDPRAGGQCIESAKTIYFFFRILVTPILEDEIFFSTVLSFASED